MREPESPFNLGVNFKRAPSAECWYDINGPAHPETLEDWQGAIQHLLCTYQPQHVYVYFGDFRPGMQKEFTVNARDGVTYTGLLTRNQDILYLFR